MALMNISLCSKSLNKTTDLRVLVNDAARPPYPVFYLLHGLSDNESDWTRRTCIEAHAAAWPFLVVMPDGARSFYCDSTLGNYETFVAKELVDWIDRTFPTRAQRRWRAIGGLSMGGYGSMKIGLKYPERFGAIAAHSGAFFSGSEWGERLSRIPEARLLSREINAAANDVFALALACPARKRPHIYFDCGREDYLIGGNDRLHRHLLRHGIRHTYRRFPGRHDWSYWNLHIQDALRYLAARMRLKLIG